MRKKQSLHLVSHMGSDNEEKQGLTSEEQLEVKMDCTELNLKNMKSFPFQVGEPEKEKTIAVR